MGFFNLLETAFFISLAITFVLIIMLVYHFKTRLMVLEQKCDTMFEIMNNMIKEMKAIQMRCSPSQQSPQPQVQRPVSGGFPIDFLSMLSGGGNGFFPKNAEYEGEDDDDDDDDEEEDTEFKKIVVSDTEVEGDEDDENVKVIHIDMNEEPVNCEELPDLEEIDTEESLEDGDIEVKEDSSEARESLDKSSEDYKKMDISYLRTLVITRGLATDTKRLKKADLVKLLSDE
jgi:hypothetical protein